MTGQNHALAKHHKGHPVPLIVVQEIKSGGTSQGQLPMHQGVFTTCTLRNGLCNWVSARRSSSLVTATDLVTETSYQVLVKDQPFRDVLWETS